MKLKILLSLFSHRLTWLSCHLLVSGLWITQSQAEVTLDGSLGSVGSLLGPNYQISADIGRQVGTNLFHSFSQFNLNSSESATFTNQGSVASIENIISRVTGGKSYIDGLLQSTIPDANLYFINPEGIVFGENAQLDVQGSFHASTADYLRLEDGTHYNARPSAADAILATAPPEAFGFLNENPSNIAVIGSQLKLPAGKIFSLIGNDIEIRNGIIFAPEGKINLISTRSVGEFLLDTNTVEETVYLRGNINITEQSKIVVSGDKAGGVFLAGKDIEISASSIFAETGDKSGNSIEINADSLYLEGESTIESQTTGAGNAGNIKIIVPEIQIDPGSEITSSTFAKGNAGNLGIQVTNLSIFGLGSPKITTGITSIANIDSTGNAGTVEEKGIGKEKVENIIINNGNTENISPVGLSSIGSNTFFSNGGNANTVEIHAKNIELIGGGAISSTSISSSGNAGKVIIKADQIRLSGVSIVNSIDVPSAIDTTALDLFPFLNSIGGNAGVIDITAKNIILENGGSISSATDTSGDAGEVNIHVSDTISLTGNVQTNKSTVITASALEGSKGKAGKINIETAHLVIDGNNSLVFTGIGSIAVSDSEGDSGTTNITANESITLLNGGAISTATFSSGNAGDVIVNTGDLIIDGVSADFLIDHETAISSNISSSAELSSTGDAGNTQVTANNIILRNGGSISSRSLGSGQVGDVIVFADDIFIDSGGSISANSQGLSQITEVNEPGKVEIQIGNSLRLANGSNITVETLSINAGDISISGQVKKTNQLITIQLSDNSQITTSVANGTGDGGNINIDKFNNTVFLSLDGDSNIIANAKEGSGGNINISTDFFFGAIDNITASSEKGISGTVNIDSPDTDISSGLLTLPANFFDSTTVLRKPCIQQSGVDVIRLVVKKYQVLPQTPYALWDHVIQIEPDSPTVESPSENSNYLKLAGLQTVNKDCLGYE